MKCNTTGSNCLSRDSFSFGGYPPPPQPPPQPSPPPPLHVGGYTVDGGQRGWGGDSGCGGWGEVGCQVTVVMELSLVGWIKC